MKNKITQLLELEVKSYRFEIHYIPTVHLDGPECKIEKGVAKLSLIFHCVQTNTVD